MRVPWTVRSNQSILKEFSPEYSLEGQILKEAPILWLFENTLMLGMIEDKRRRGQQRMRWLDGVTDSMDMSMSKLRQMVKDREAWRAPV